MSLTKGQLEQIKKQLEVSRTEKYEVDIRLTEGHVLRKFGVYPDVLAPEKVTALHLARWLFFNNGLYRGKTAIDMGSGTGIQGIVMKLYGAKQVIFSDVSLPARINSSTNLGKYVPKSRHKIYEGDLFENIEDKVDVIVFNHPFFQEKPADYVPVSMAMLDDGKLIHRFLDHAKDHLLENGVIVMPYFHPAGPTNDPGKQAPKHDYTVNERFRGDIDTELHKGLASIYELRLK